MMTSSNGFHGPRRSLMKAWVFLAVRCRRRCWSRSANMARRCWSEASDRQSSAVALNRKTQVGMRPIPPHRDQDPPEARYAGVIHGGSASGRSLRKTEPHFVQIAGAKRTRLFSSRPVPELTGPRMHGLGKWMVNGSRDASQDAGCRIRPTGAAATRGLAGSPAAGGPTGRFKLPGQRAPEWCRRRRSRR